mmetsp:Transcript_19790/g.44100  ORF Transcript_19790/g.44100 Transcript_19790/m.44100 type:complete len:416 (-) Transcript_19790:1124-2371(-)|eukprot:CAMPEP_0178554094 /NCGR_PEP_ID=MMETSP0697-20121206/8155_1 /TAXON_ID=265572 /ORGANISM="Extubocellulus spinifer, Strain CCMP396" /LENGTH=415 /DNA_ID=CAMNT_0020187031 /DNA_START=287 /DNA_END=1534 /DNA_ORIENTATION=-
MHLSSATNKIVSQATESGATTANGVPAQGIAPAIVPSSQRDTDLLTRDDVIDMIVRARWWSPELTYKPEPLSTLFLHNETQESGWLRAVLFPTGASEQSNEEFTETLMLSYLLTLAEGKGMTAAAVKALGMTTESAFAMRKKTIESFAYFPVDAVLLNQRGCVTREEKVAFLSTYPSGCFRNNRVFSGQDRLVMAFLDAALHTQRCRHVKHIRALFNCSASSINSNHSNLVRSLFAGFKPAPPQPLGWKEVIDSRSGNRLWYNFQTHAVQSTRPALPEETATAVNAGAPTTTSSTRINQNAHPTIKAPAEAAEATDPSPKSVTEVNTAGEAATAKIIEKPMMPKTNCGDTRRTPFANKSNGNGNGNFITLQPAGILKTATIGKQDKGKTSKTACAPPAPKGIQSSNDENTNVSVQ